MQQRVYLDDDGTLDTVFACVACNMSLRYSGEAFERDESGALVDQKFAERIASEDHEGECPNGAGTAGF